MPTSVELRQQRARVVESLRGITETAEQANRNLEAQERESYDRHESEFRELTEICAGFFDEQQVADTGFQIAPDMVNVHLDDLLLNCAMMP